MDIIFKQKQLKHTADTLYSQRLTLCLLSVLWPYLRKAQRPSCGYNDKALIKVPFGSFIPLYRFVSFAGLVSCRIFPSSGSLATLLTLAAERRGNWTVLSKLRALPLEAYFPLRPAELCRPGLTQKCGTELSAYGGLEILKSNNRRGVGLRQWHGRGIKSCTDHKQIQSEE